jgi:hypothetical protein
MVGSEVHMEASQVGAKQRPQLSRVAEKDAAIM